jgi:hypothetical protein
MKRRPRATSRSRDRVRRQNYARSAWLFLFLAIGIIGVAFYYIWQNQPPIVDRATNCPKESQLIKSSISILLDTTESLSATQRKLIQNTLYGVIYGAAPYDRIKIYEVHPSYDSLLNPVFNYCKPSKNELGSPVIQQFEELRFKQRIREYLDDQDYDLPQSPIIRAIGSVASDFSQDSSIKRLIVASDFIENSDIMNQYKSDWLKRYSDNKKIINDLRPNLSEVYVSMLFIPRASVPHHDQDFAKWWRQYLRDSGGLLTEQMFLNDESGKSFILEPFIPITG